MAESTDVIFDRLSKTVVSFGEDAFRWLDERQVAESLLVRVLSESKGAFSPPLDADLQSWMDAVKKRLADGSTDGEATNG